MRTVYFEEGAHSTALLFVCMKGARAMANYELQCERCDRPAEVVSRKIGRQRSGHETVKKTVPSECDCGGKIVPAIE